MTHIRRFLLICLVACSTASYAQNAAVQKSEADVVATDHKIAPLDMNASIDATVRSAVSIAMTSIELALEKLEIRIEPIHIDLDAMEINIEPINIELPKINLEIEPLKIDMDDDGH